MNLNSNANFQIGRKVQQGGVVVSRCEMLKCWNRNRVCAAAGRVCFQQGLKLCPNNDLSPDTNSQLRTSRRGIWRSTACATVMDKISNKYRTYATIQCIRRSWKLHTGIGDQAWSYSSRRTSRIESRAWRERVRAALGHIEDFRVWEKELVVES